MVMLSSLEDIGYYFGGSEVIHVVEVREKEKRFVKRK
jgi:hypothetical protein